MRLVQKREQHIRSVYMFDICSNTYTTGSKVLRQFEKYFKSTTFDISRNFVLAFRN